MPSLPQTTNHAPVTVALVAGAAVNVLIAVVKAKFGVDFSGQEANLIVLATAVGYLVPGIQAKLGAAS